MKDNFDRPKSYWKTLFQNLALAIFVFALCICGLEITLRLIGYGNLEIYSPDSQLFWRLKPDQNCFTKVDRKPVRINQHGTRGDEFTTDKPSDTIRILSLGDSRTFGWGLEDSETYSARLQQLFQNEFEERKKVEVINAGVNAWSFMQMYVYLREHGIRFSPDIVILADANFWTQFSEHSSPEFLKTFLQRVWLKNFMRRFAIYHYFIEIQLREYYERHRSKFIPVDPGQDSLFKEEQQDDPDKLFAKAIEDICLLSKQNGIHPILINLPVEGDWDLTETPVPLRIKQQVAEKLNVSLIDMTESIKSHNENVYLHADPVHFNSEGNKLIAINLFEYLKTPVEKILKKNEQN